MGSPAEMSRAQIVFFVVIAIRFAPFAPVIFPPAAVILLILLVTQFGQQIRVIFVAPLHDRGHD